MTPPEGLSILSRRAADGSGTAPRGRERELETLRALLLRARGGRGAALTILAGPGMGKTTLLETVVQEALPDFRALGVRGNRQESGYPLAGLHRLLRPVPEAIRRLSAPRLPAPTDSARLPRPPLPPAGSSPPSPAPPASAPPASAPPASPPPASAPLLAALPLAPPVARTPAEAAAVAADVMDPPVTGPLAIYTAVHRALAEIAARGPLLCWVDDARRLDRVSLEALTFAARRLTTEPILMLFADRGEPGAGSTPGCLADIPALALRPLDEAAGLRVLEDHVGGGLPRDLAGGLTELAAGNPLALVELAAALTREQLCGQAPPPASLPRRSRLRALFRRRYLRLPAGARQLVLMAVADERLDLPALARAAATAGIQLRELETARASGLIDVDDETVVVPSPLIRSSLYADATPDERDAVHRLLANVLDQERDRLRRGCHLAATARGPDSALAGELGEAAGAARSAGRYAESAYGWRRAAALTSGSDARAGYMIAAAADSWLAGRTQQTRALLWEARPYVRSPDLRGIAELLRGEIELRDGAPAAAMQILLSAADRLAGSHRDLAITALMHAADAGHLAGDPRCYPAITRHAAALRAAAGDPPPAAAKPLAPMPAAAARPASAELMLDHIAGMTATYQGRHAEAAQALTRVLRLAEATDDWAAKIWASEAARALGDDVRAYDLAGEAVDLARGQGAVAPMPTALGALAMTAFFLDRYPAAVAYAQDGLRMARAAGQANCAIDHTARLALLAAWQGDKETALGHVEAIAEQVHRRGLARPGALISWALGCLALSEGRPADAAARLRFAALTGPTSHGIRAMAIPQFVEAAVRCGQREQAAAALEGFARWASSTRSPARLALVRRCRGLLADRDAAAGEHFRQALRLHRRSDASFELARTELAYGHRLRRDRKPGAAREHLRNALQIFERYGAGLWTDRARAELRAAGIAAERQDAEPATHPALDELTPQQLQIARFVAEGATNREIAARLALSHRTIDHHLRNIFVRLDIRSRVELARLLR